MSRKVLLCAGIAASAVFAHAQETIGYQGYLSLNGEPVTGAYDLRFDVRDTPILGNSLGMVEVLGVDVRNGLFTTEVPFPDGTFGQSPLYFELGVREADPDGAYEVLFGRQKVSAAAAAVEDLGEPWAESGSGIVYGDGTKRVLINRQAPVTTSEVFGVGFDGLGFGGMYVQGSSPTAIPFYGYSVEAGADAYHFYDADNNRWGLFVDGLAMLANATEVEVLGRLVVDQEVEASFFRYQEPTGRALSLGPHAFVGREPEALRYTIREVSPRANESELAYAPLSLPDGARITGFRAGLWDSTNSGFTRVTLIRKENGSLNTIALATVTTDGLASMSSVRVLTDRFSPVNVDNSTHNFLVQVEFFGDGAAGLELHDVVIEYEVLGPG